MSTLNISSDKANTEECNFISRVFGWMSFALLITGFVAMWVASSPQLVDVIIGNSYVFYGLLIGQLICVVYLSSVVNKISVQLAQFIFIIYAALNGLTFSTVFLAFTSESIATTFIITAGTFGVMSLYGYFTKKDLTKIGNLALMALIGLIITSIVNWFFNSETFYWISTSVGILIFIALIAYDTQKIKAMNRLGNEGTDADKKEAVMAALTLYLDFINLFHYFLRLFGKKK